MKRRFSYHFWFALIAFVFQSRSFQAQQLGFTLTSDSVVYEYQNYISFYATGNIQNLSNSDTIIVDIIRVENDMPPGWESAICIFTCLTSSYDSTAVVLEPGQSEQLKMYFRKNFGAIGDSAHAKLLILYQNNSGNYFLQNFYGIDTLPDITSLNEISGMNLLSVTPNPFSEKAIVHFPADVKKATLMIYNSRGQLVKTYLDVNGKSLEINDHHLPPGLYHINLWENNLNFSTKVLVIK